MTCSRDSAVSPVVGVMLMLVVVIIIAAVVSGFAGGLMKGTQSAPQLVMDVHIQNSGYYPTSYFKAEVTSVSAPIKTSDLKLVTSWSNTGNRSGVVIRSGSVVTPGVTNFNVSYVTESSQDVANPPAWQMVCPQGDGPGVGFNGTETANGLPYEGTGAMTQADIGPKVTNYSWFGNYNLQAGTVMYAQPFGAKYDATSFTVGYGITKQWTYTNGTDSSGGAVFDQSTGTDEMQAVLGKNWNFLRPGDIVNVKLIHIPSGKTIWQGDISVEGSTV
jgi:archaeal type IV pilus assembly protein PilA